MEIPGIATTHCVISDNCRKIHGDEGALDVSFERIRKDYLEILKNREGEKEVNYRVVLLVEGETYRKGSVK